MQKVAVQIRQTMPDVIEGQKEEDKSPVQDTHENKETNERGNLANAPIGIRSALPFDFPKDSFGIVSQIAQKNVAPDVLGFAIVTTAIDRQPIDSLPFLVGSIAVPHMVPMMHVFVKRLGESKRHRFQQREHPIQWTPTEIRVVDEVVRDPVDVPGDANRVDESHANQHPPRSHRKERKQRQDISKMQNPAQGRQRIPFRIGQDLHTH